MKSSVLIPLLVWGSFLGHVVYTCCVFTLYSFLCDLLYTWRLCLPTRNAWFELKDC